MRGRLLLAGLGVAVGASSLFAQFPPPARKPPIQIPRLPDPPNPTPPITPPGSIPPGFPNSPAAPGFPVQPTGGLPPANPPSGPVSPAEPRPLPPLMPATPPASPPTPLGPSAPVVPPAVPQPGPSFPTQPGLPDGSTLPPGQADIPLPYPEQKIPFDAGAVSLKRLNGGWQVWLGQRVFRDLGDNEAAAKDVAQTLRELRPTEWVSIGSPRPVVEYGLVNGRPGIVGGFPKQVIGIDLRNVRVEPVRGVWCVRDDDNILFNFGLNKAEAEQAVAVIRKYGFNRVGVVGTATFPAMTYLFVTLEADKAAKPPSNPLITFAQENSLTRTGIPVPGLGYVGEMTRIDPRKVEARREGYEWVLASGPDVLGRFGPSEWAARDALRVIQDCRFTEYCRLGGTSNLTFFLTNGKAPTRVPFAAQGTRFAPADLKTQRAGTGWVVAEGGRPVFEVGGPEEGEAVIRVLKYFGFDTLCHVGPSPKLGLHFLGKSR